MGYGIKGHSQIEEDEDGEKTRVSWRLLVIFNNAVSVLWRGRKPELFVEVIVTEVCVKLEGDSFLKDFGFN